MQDSQGENYLQWCEDRTSRLSKKYPGPSLEVLQQPLRQTSSLRLSCASISTEAALDLPVYINSFLAMLNARQSVSEATNSSVSVSLRDLRSAPHFSPTSPVVGKHLPDSANDGMTYPPYGERKQVLSWAEPEP
ncbi:hypothetical protein HWV62_43876 [Athelia sp. TMB]|nr:hypothetical protein HWV62_43876 [Athelia sp. TMB]